MTRTQYYGKDPHIFREAFWKIASCADEMSEREDQLVKLLAKFDERRFYVYFGYKSLSGFCAQALKLSRTQSQRIVTRVRRARNDES